MKVRIISDLHIDINENYPLSYNDDTFTIIAGDVCGDPYDKIKWINTNIKNGIYIAGNHIVYNDLNSTIRHSNIRDAITLNKIKNYIAEINPMDAAVTFLNNQYKIIEDKVFIGSTLYTDYNYSCDYGYSQKDNMWEAARGLNDFRYGYYCKDDMNVNLSPAHYLIEFKKAFDFIKETVEKFKDKQCIVITHHAPSAKSIAWNYHGSQTNASYISELDEFITSHTNISHWIHGHVHSTANYRIGNTDVICNPRGYIGSDASGFNENLIIEL